jgi:AcrR family transcriptional regulator
MPSSSPSTPRAQQTRRAILAAAAQCFAKSGFDGAGVADIASAASLTVPTLYNHFAGKQALLEALLAELLADMDQLFDVLLPRGLTFAQKLELLIAHQFRWSEARRHAFQFFLTFPVRVAVQGDPSQSHVQNLQRWIETHATAEELSVPADVAALMHDALANGIFRQWIRDGAPPGALVAKAPLVADLILYGVAAAPVVE